jgi:hypothetical protein
MCLPDELTVVDAHSVLEGNVAANACLSLPEFDDRHPVISRRRRPDNKDRTVRYLLSKNSALISAPLGVLQQAFHMVIQSGISFPETVQDPAFYQTLLQCAEISKE